MGEYEEKTKFLVALSISINIISIFLAVFIIGKLGGVDYVLDKVNPNEKTYADNSYYIERTSLFEGIEIPKNSIVFLGDSITQRGMWNELFLNSSNVVNRGINSDTTEGVKNRLTKIIESKPDKLFIMVGINDFRYGVPTEDAISNYESILKRIKKETPETEVYVQSILPVNHSMDMNIDVVKNEEIKDFNISLENMTNELNFNYVNLYPLFEKDGELNGEISIDGVHLNGDGYNIWKDAIESYIDES